MHSTQVLGQASGLPQPRGLPTAPRPHGCIQSQLPSSLGCIRPPGSRRLQGCIQPLVTTYGLPQARAAYTPWLPQPPGLHMAPWLQPRLPRAGSPIGSRPQGCIWRLGSPSPRAAYSSQTTAYGLPQAPLLPACRLEPTVILHLMMVLCIGWFTPGTGRIESNRIRTDFQSNRIESIHNIIRN